MVGGGDRACWEEAAGHGGRRRQGMVGGGDRAWWEEETGSKHEGDHVFARAEAASIFAINITEGQG